AKGFVCICEDVTEKDLKRALAEGFDSLELAKRYTTVTMGPCQGRLCHLASSRLFARECEVDPAEIGTTTARPPWSPVKLGLLAGRGHEPAKRTSLHHRHMEADATMMWTGAWRRPHSYGDAALAAVNVAGPRARELLGRLTSADVSPEGFKYLDARQAAVAGVTCLALRIGFVGELGYELHFPSVCAEYLWDTLLECGADLGAKPFGLEAQRILRLEKQHIIVG